MYPDLPTEIQTALDTLLREGREFEAIELYREHTAADLESAREVMYIRQDQLADMGDTADLDGYDDASEYDSGTPGYQPDQAQDDAEKYLRKARKHIENGNEFEAIIAYRMATGDDRKQAQKAVEKIAHKIQAEHSLTTFFLGRTKNGFGVLHLILLLFGLAQLTALIRC